MTQDRHRPGHTATFDPDELGRLERRLRGALDIRDRQHGFPARTYERCFVGADAVETLIEDGSASDEADAVRLGNMLLDAGVFHHVLDEHRFENAYLFYRFRSDEDHGAAAPRPGGGTVSWSDFIAPLTGDGEPGLQPRIPERDPHLASFAQDELDAIGVEPLDEHNAALLDHTHPPRWRNPAAKGRYNLVVVGGGAGGLVAAAGAAGVGAQVALIESHLLGGDCLNVGCVPSKALALCARAVAAARTGTELGVRISGDIEVDFAAVMRRMRRVRARLAGHDSAERFARDLGVDVFIGRGRFTGSNTVEVDGTAVAFAKAVIATGGTAARPDIPGLDRAPFLTNATLFNLTTRPDRLGVIGAGPIGIELAQAFQRFGSQVTVFARGGQILPREDRDAVAVVEAALRRDGVTVESPTSFARIESSGPGAPLTVVFDDAGGTQRSTVDALLVAIGRKPAVVGLGLEAAGIEYDERTGVRINDRLQTSNPDVFAVGDVATAYQFTHMADFMARLAVRNALFLGRDRHTRLLIPWVTYTDPEVAHVGLYPHDLEERGIAFATYTRRLSDVDRAVLDGATEGFVKVHVRKGTDQILGATIVAAHAGDLVSELTTAMHGGIGLGALAGVIHPYPTVAEAIRQCGDAYNRTRLTPTVKRILARYLSVQRR